MPGTSSPQRPKKKKHSQGRKKDQKAAAKAHRALAKAMLEGDDASEFVAWLDYLASRQPRPSLGALFPAGCQPLLWCVDKKAFDLQPAWCELAASAPPSGEFGLECLWHVHQLAANAQSMTHHEWKRLFATLVDVAHECSNQTSLAEELPWESQLLLGELPLTLAYYFPEVESARKLGVQGAEFVSQSVEELLDGSGMPEAQHLDVMRKLAACWLRCFAMSAAIDRKACRISKSARQEFDWMIRQLLRLMRADRGQCFADSVEKSFGDMIQAAVDWNEDEEDDALLELTLHRKKVLDERLPEDPSYHSEWAEVAVLQPEWAIDQPRLVLSYDNARLRAELSNRGQRILSGDWQPELTIDGELVEQVSEWEVNCWFDDFDVDFLELESQLSNGWTIQRQFLLARQDHFLWTADILLGEEPCHIEYRSILPLVSGLEVSSNGENQENLVRGKKLLAKIAPLSLSEWNSQRHQGQMQTVSGKIELLQRQHGAAMCVPLFFDLHRQRLRQVMTWRQLTVAENLEIVRPDVAVGYRVQAGREQWIWYRALLSKANRTLLGQNLTDEFMCCRFLNDGDTDEIVSIE